MRNKIDPFETPKWEAVLLICRQCRKRKNGPLDLKPKALFKIARSLLKERRPRPRVVLSSCLGLCPKSATAVAFLGSGTAPRIAKIENWEELEEALPRLIEQPAAMDLA